MLSKKIMGCKFFCKRLVGAAEGWIGAETSGQLRGSCGSETDYL